MVKKEWSDDEEVAAIQEYLKYKKFLDKGTGDKKRYLGQNCQCSE